MNLSTHLLCEEEAHPRSKILRFAGEADFLAVPAVRQLLKKLLGQRIPFLIVDLSGVTFLNTPFWAALQRYQIDGHPNSRLALCGMNEALKAAFDINGVGLGSVDGGCIAVYLVWGLSDQQRTMMNQAPATPRPSATPVSVGDVAGEGAVEKCPKTQVNSF